MATRPVLLYDADCRLCRFAARTVIRLDRSGELAVVSLQDVEAERLLEPLRDDERYASWRLALPDGSLVAKGTGAPELLRTLRLTRAAGRLLERVPDRVLDSLYDAVARNRGRLGRLVPDGPAPRRFP